MAILLLSALRQLHRRHVVRRLFVVRLVRLLFVVRLVRLLVRVYHSKRGLMVYHDARRTVGHGQPASLWFAAARRATRRRADFVHS